MNKTRTVLMALVGGLALLAAGCSKTAATGPLEDWSEGELNQGPDQNTGIVNDADGDLNGGVINTDLDANFGAETGNATGIRKPDGTCYNDTDMDGLCNEEDSDIDGDGIPNTSDPDIDGDGIPNTSDPDIDGDGIINIDDNDIDGDGIANTNDNDIDGDGISNEADSDIDGDGIANIDDNDIDGDGIPNEQDTDLDGDGVPNTEDNDIDGDGITNANDNDIDGDGISNTTDPDLDGDGIPNEQDTDLDGDGLNNDIDDDDDGDGIPDAQDQDANSDGVIENPNAEVPDNTITGRFSEVDTVTVTLYAGTQTATGTDESSFDKIRSRADEEGVLTSSLNAYEVEMHVLAGSEAVLAANAGLTVKINVYYDEGAGPVLIARGSNLLLGDIANRPLVEGSDIFKTEAFPNFQEGMINPTRHSFTYIVELVPQNGAILMGGTIQFEYELKVEGQKVI